MVRRHRHRQIWTEEDRVSILLDAEASGLSVVAFAKQLGIHWTTLYAWRRKALARPGGEGVKTRRKTRRRVPAGLGSVDSSAAFLPVKVISHPDVQTIPDPAPIVLMHRSGWRVFVPRAFDAAQLGQVLSTVDAQC